MNYVRPEKWAGLIENVLMKVASSHGFREVVVREEREYSFASGDFKVYLIREDGTFVEARLGRTKLLSTEFKQGAHGVVQLLEAVLEKAAGVSDVAVQQAPVAISGPGLPVENPVDPR